MRARSTSQPMRAAIVIVIVALGAWAFRDMLLTFLIEPIGWLLWAGWRILASIDRSLIWLIIIVASSLLIIRLVPPDLVGGDGDEAHRTPTSNSGDRLAHWRALAARSTADVDGRSAIRLGLEAMASSVAEATRTPPPAPPEAPDNGSRGQSGMARISRMLPDHRRREDARRIEDLLNWMEAALEIKHEQ